MGETVAEREGIEGWRERGREWEKEGGREREGRERERETVSNVDVTHSVVLRKRVSSILNIDVQFDKKYSLVTELSNKLMNKLHLYPAC